ncbi:MAG: TetR/AcrR family transcriptional regulator [Pseudomonadota bacterium]
MTNSIPSPSPAPRHAPDQRGTVAQKKHLAVNERLLAATFEVFSRAAAPSVDDVIRQAKVSRATFHKHFASLDDAFSAVALRLSAQLSAGFGPFLSTLDSPVERTCVGARLLLLRAAADPQWAGFVQRAHVDPRDSDIYRLLAAHLAEGKALGHFDYADLRTVTDLIMGVNLAAIRGIRDTGADELDSYIDAACEFVLRALAVPRVQRMNSTAFARNYVLVTTDGRNWWEAAVQDARQDA